MLNPLGRRGGSDPRRRRQVSILYGEAQSGLGHSMRAAMAREGFQDIAVFSTLAPLAQAVRNRDPDLVVIDADLPGGDACGFVKEIREGRMGSNPFVAAVATTFQPTKDRVRAVVDSGADDLIAKPMSPEQLLSRMAVLVEHRKPFVVTSDYIGPDRRRDSDPDDGFPRFRVPNTLRAKMRGEAVGAVELRQMIAAALTEINEARLQRHAIQVGLLVQSIVPAYLAGRRDAAIGAMVEKLGFVASDAAGRLKGTAYEHVAELCAALVGVVEAVGRAHPNPAEKDLKLLPRLAEAMAVGFDATGETARAAEAIARSVGRYAGTAPGPASPARPRQAGPGFPIG